MYKKRLKSWGCSKYIRTNAHPRLVPTSSSTPPVFLKLPANFRASEFVLIAIQDYIKEKNDKENPRSAFDSKAVLQSEAHKHSAHDICRETLDAIFSGFESGLDVQTFSRSAAEFISSVEACRELLCEHQMQAAFSELRRLPIKIQRLLRDEPHHVLHGLFFAVIKMNWDGEDSEDENAILRTLLKYIAACAGDSALAWPETYPLRRILEGFSHIESHVDLAEVAIKCWKYFLNMSKPPGDEDADTSCVISSFSLPRTFRSAAGRQDTTTKPALSAYERLGIDRHRTR